MTVIIKQYGLERSGTNYTKAMIEMNFKEVRVFSNLFGKKHHPFNCTSRFLENYNPHQDKDVITDLSKEEIDRFHAMALDGKLLYIVTFKDPYSWIISYNDAVKTLTDDPCVLTDDKIKRYAEVWNICNRHCVDSILVNLREKSIGIKYQDLLLHTKMVLDKVATRFSLCWNEPILNIDSYMSMGVDKRGIHNINTNKIFDKREYYEKEQYMQALDARHVPSHKRLRPDLCRGPVTGARHPTITT